MESELFTSVLIIITFLSVAMVASLALKRLHFPYTIGLMVIGLGIGWMFWSVPGLESFRSLELSPDIILYLILPTLIFEASMNIDARLLFRNLGPITLLAVGGLLVSAAVVAFGLTSLTTMTLAGALLFGALISATDPVAVIALFKEIGAPKRLITLIDGESLFNDATAIVLFTVIATAVGMSGGHGGDASVFAGAVSFVVVLLGGLAVGGIIGWVGSWVIQVDKGNFLFQMAISMIMAYLSFLIADHVFHFSGVMSSLAAGLALRYRAETAFKRHHLHTVEQGWEFFSFVANSFVFILLGLTAFNSVLYQGDIVAEWWPILISLPIVLVARFLSVYLLVVPYNWVSKLWKESPVPWGYQAILFWGGLRGAVPVALVLAIPTDFPDRNLILHLTFGIILFTMLIQGTTVKKVMDWLGIKPDGTPFADRPTSVSRFDFPDEGLAGLVLSQTRRDFEAEGFLATEQAEDHDDDWLLRRGAQMLTLRRDAAQVVIECEPKDVEYVSVVVQESLVSLKNAVGSIHQATGAATTSGTTSAAGSSASASPVLKALKPVNIVLELPRGSKEQVIRALLDRLEHNGDVRDPRKAFEDVMEREKSMTTGLGKGIATPHAKTEAVDKLVLALGYCREGTDFAALDGQTTNYVALILSPKGEEGPHLQVLSMITGLLNREELRTEIADAHSPELAYHAVRVQASRWRNSSR